MKIHSLQDESDVEGESESDDEELTVTMKKTLVTQNGVEDENEDNTKDEKSPQITRPMFEDVDTSDEEVFILTFRFSGFISFINLFSHNYQSITFFQKN